MGNKYAVDILVFADFSEAALRDRLSATVNYEALYQITVAVMNRPARLLEHIAHNLIADIKQQFPAVDSVEVSVSKFNPPHWWRVPSGQDYAPGIKRLPGPSG